MCVAWEKTPNTSHATARPPATLSPLSGEHVREYVNVHVSRFSILGPSNLSSLLPEVLMILSLLVLHAFLATFRPQQKHQGRWTRRLRVRVLHGDIYPKSRFSFLHHRPGKAQVNLRK